MERRQEAGFLSPICSKITRTKEKEMSKRKSEEEERSRREKSMVTLLVFTMATLEIVFGRKKKNCWTQKVQLAVTFSEIRLDCITLFRS